MEVQRENEKKSQENYFAPYMMAEVLERNDGMVTFLLHVGYSCPQKMTWKESRFEEWLKEKDFRTRA